MPGRIQTHIDKALTEISVKYNQDPGAFIASRVFPMVPVMKQSDRYFMYKKEDWFRDDAEERAMGTESAGGDYDIDNTPTYFCKKYAYHKDVFEEDRVNSDNPLMPDEDATEFVTDKLRLRKEIAWATAFFKTGVWATDITGVASGPTGPQVLQWNDANSTPIEDVRKYATAQAKVTGKRPNTLVLGQEAYDSLADHPDMLDRIKYTQKGVVTTDLLATLFEVEQVLVASAIKNTAAKGQNASMSFIFGKGALLCYSESRPAIKKASAGYIFTWKGLMGTNAFGQRVLRIPVPLLGEGAERIEGELAFDMKVVAADMGTYFATIVA